MISFKSQNVGIDLRFSKNFGVPKTMTSYQPLSFSCYSVHSFYFFVRDFVVELLEQGPVVQSMVSLTSSLRGQLVKCFTTS